MDPGKALISSWYLPRCIFAGCFSVGLFFSCWFHVRACLVIIDASFRIVCTINSYRLHPALLSCHSYCRASLIYSLLGLSPPIGRLFSPGWMSGVLGGLVLFSSFSKCSAHLLTWSSFPMIVIPSLSLTGLSFWLAIFTWQFSGDAVLETCW